MTLKLISFLSLATPALAVAAPWNMYDATQSAIVSPKTQYATQNECVQSAKMLDVAKAAFYFCKNTETATKTVGDVTTGSYTVTTVRVLVGPQTPIPPVTPSPPVVDHSKMIEINDALIPVPTKFSDRGQYGEKLAQNTLNIMSPSPEAVNGSDIGAFRTGCVFSHMLYDDPIVFPKQPGKSHLHVFFGNMSANADTTTDNIRNGIGSTCSGGLANMTAYWAPAMIDTGNHAPLRPSAFIAYYKTGYGAGPAAVKAPPTGLRMITGSASNADPAGAQNTRYICYGPKGENPGWETTITAALAKSMGKDSNGVSLGNCGVGSEFVMEVTFPQCWDGVNLDSPNHNSHMAGVIDVTKPGQPYTVACPDTHPTMIPQIAYNIHYTVTDINAPKRWRLASDAYANTLPAGLSGHADYMIGWDEKVKATWMKNCDNARVDCHADNLGDGSRLSNN